MKIALLVLLSLGAAAFAQEQKRDRTQPPPDTRQAKRLDSVTWDLKNHKLVWVIQSGSDVNGRFVMSSTDKYEISPDEATMAVAEEKRGFTREEAQSLRRLLDVLSMYCAESVVWWDQGQGEPLDPGKPGRERRKDAPGDGKPRRVEKPLPRLTDETTAVASVNEAR